VEYVSLAEAVGRLRTVPLDCDTLLAGRELGISFGDD
jgi:6-phosphofructokinase 1